MDDKLFEQSFEELEKVIKERIERDRKKMEKQKQDEERQRSCQEYDEKLMKMREDLLKQKKAKTGNVHGMPILRRNARKTKKVTKIQKQEKPERLEKPINSSMGEPSTSSQPKATQRKCKRVSE